MTSRRHLFMVGVLSFLCISPISSAKPLDLQQLPHWGNAQGAGSFSLTEKASPMQIALSLDQPLSIALGDGKMVAHRPIFASAIMLKLWGDNVTPKRSVWLATSAQPLGVSLPYSNQRRLAQSGMTVNRLQVKAVTPVGNGQIRVDTGIVQQHLGNADSLYWTALTPRHWTSESLRLFDTSLGLNTTYVNRSFYLEVGVGAPIESDGAPFESAQGLRSQLVTGWALSDANVLLGVRMDQGGVQTEHEVNLRWHMPLRIMSADIPMYFGGELGGITIADEHKNAIGSVYANHEIGLELSQVTLRIRYDWMDRDTHFKYDTMHLARASIDYHGMDYLIASAQFRHRWRDRSDRLETDRDDILLFLRLVY